MLFRLKKAVAIALVVFLIVSVFSLFTQTESSVKKGTSSPAAPFKRPVAAGAASSFGSASKTGQLAAAPPSLWFNVSNTFSGGPGGLFGAATAYDPVSQSVVVFGGQVPNRITDYTWLFHGGKWTNVTKAVAPSPRKFASMAYDARDGYTLLFGGYNGGTYYGDTWEYVGGNWSQLTPTQSPTARYSAALAYDPATQSVILYGGCGAGSCAVNDSWAFANGQWTSVATKTGQPNLYFTSAVYDPVDREVVTFGGCTGLWGCPAELNVTWVYNASGWNNVTATAGRAPSARGLAQLAWDGNDNTTVLFGGADLSQIGTYKDTWSFVHGVWSQWTEPQSPPALASYIALWDPAEQFDFLYGGINSQNVVSSGIWVLTHPLNVTATASPTTVHVGRSISFNGASTGGIPPVSFLWSFGDGSVALGTSASHSYASPGSKAVQFAATDAYGELRVAFITVSVAQNLSLTIAPSASAVDVGILYNVSASAANAIGPVSYLWSWGDGSQSRGSPAAHAYGQPHLYSIVTAATDGTGFNASETVQLIVNPPPSATSSLNRTSLKVNGAVAFFGNESSGTGPFTFSWNFGDGQSAVAQNITHVYRATGGFLVTLTVTDADGLSAVSANVVTVTAPPGSPTTKTNATASPTVFGLPWWGWGTVAGVGVITGAFAFYLGRRARPIRSAPVPFEEPRT